MLNPALDANFASTPAVPKQITVQSTNNTLTSRWLDYLQDSFAKLIYGNQSGPKLAIPLADVLGENSVRQRVLTLFVLVTVISHLLRGGGSPVR